MTNQKGYIKVRLLIAIVIIVGALVYLVAARPGTNPAPSPQPSPTPTPTSPDETASWKTYSNSQYGVEFKYPKGWDFVAQHNSLIDFGPRQPTIGSGIVVVDLACGFASDISNAKTYTIYYPSNGGPSADCQYINVIARTTDAVDTAGLMQSTFKFSSNETAGWKVYNNAKLGFEFKYPDEWKSKETYESGLNYLNLQLSSTEMNTLLLVNSPGVGFENYSVQVSSDNLTVAGTSATLLIMDESSEFVQSSDISRGVFIQFRKDGNEYFFLFSYRKNGPDRLALVKQILSTFRFTK